VRLAVDEVQDMTSLSAACSHATESGSLLVASVVYWSPHFSPGLLPATVLAPPSGLGRMYHYMTRPVHFAGRKCALCRAYRTDGLATCSHEFVSGFVFPYSPLLWWAGAEPFRPTFLYSIVRRSKSGGEPEVVFAPKLLLVSISDARCPARKCVRCESVEILSGAPAAV
jgi:hypothetical protein